MEHILKNIKSAPFVEVNYNDFSSTPLTYSTTIKNFSIKLPLSLIGGSELAQAFNKITNGKASFLGDISEKSVAELTIPDSVNIHYNPLFGKVQLHFKGPFKLILSNPDKSTLSLISTTSDNKIELESDYRTLLARPSEYQGSWDYILKNIRRLHIFMKNVKIIEETTQKPFYTSDQEEFSIDLTLNQNNEIDLGLSINQQNKQFHKIEENGFVKDILLLDPNFFILGPSSLKFEIAGSVKGDLKDISNLPTTLKEADVTLKTFSESNQYYESEIHGSGQYSNPVKKFKVEGSFLAKETFSNYIKEYLNNASGLIKSALENVPTGSSISPEKILSVMPDFYKIGKIFFGIDFDIAGENFDKVGGHFYINSPPGGFKISGKGGSGTDALISGNIEFQNTDVLLDNLEAYILRVSEIIEPDKINMVTSFLVPGKIVLKSILKPSSDNSKNHTLEITFDRKKETVSLNGKKFEEIISSLPPAGLTQTK